MPHILRRVLDVRAIIEGLPAQSFKDSPLLHEAYGRSLYKCPMTQCDRFHRGFLSRELRDQHWKAHERAYKCTIEGCDYLGVGFPTSADLTRHEQLCHCELDEITFPSVKRASITQTLKDAIDRDDASATRDICGEMKVYPTEETGFLFRAVTRKSYSAALVLLELLGSNGELRHKDVNGRTVLHEAVRCPHMDLLKEILDTDVDVNAMDSSRKKRTPLSEALEYGHFDAVRLLFGHPNTNLKPYDYTSSYRKGFIGASSGGHNDIVRAIFRTFVENSGKQRDWVSPWVSKALASAASNGHESTFALIQVIGREFDLERHYSKHLKKVLRMGIEAMKPLEKTPEKPEVAKNGKTKHNALKHAARKDDSATVLRLLEKGADINFVSGLHSNALQSASESGNLPMVELLISKGADVDTQGGYLGNALQAAARSGHIQVVKRLLEKGANINAQGGKYENALQAAVRSGHIQVMETLLEQGANINAQGGEYDNALQVAVKGGSTQVVQMLLEKGANINARGGIYGNALVAATANGHVEVVQILLEKGADINAQGGYGNALQVASTIGRDQVVRTLLEAGADVNPPGGLQRALRHKHIVQMLRERGANLDT